MPTIDKTPKSLKPYAFHRMVLDLDKNEKGAIADCPFCESGKTLFLYKDTGQGSCRKCSYSGNAYTFLRKLHSIGTQPQFEIEEVANERKVDVSTLKHWGLVKSVIDGEWMLPGYGLPSKKEVPEINNLYRWSLQKKLDGTYKRRLFSTAEMDNTLFGTQFWDPKKPNVFLLEGPWDAMKLWEALQKYRLDQNKYVRTVDVARSLYSIYNVLAVPGVDTFKDGWESEFSGKNVLICYDSDHPKKNKKTEEMEQPLGLRGMKKTAGKIRANAKSIKYLNWGPEGYSELLKDGYDVRDLLTVV